MRPNVVYTDKHKKNEIHSEKEVLKCKTTIRLLEWSTPIECEATVTMKDLYCTVELQWPEHFWNHENIFDTGVV